MNPDHEAWLQDIVCGDRRIDDPEVRARLETDPVLLAEVAGLLRAQQQLALLGDDDDTAALAAEPVRAADRAAVVAAMLPRVRHRTVRVAWLAVAAALLVAAVPILAGLLAPAPVDGPLGDGGAMDVLRDEQGYRVVIREALPPGASFHLRLELAGGTVWTAETESSTWLFPTKWQDAVALPGPHRLVVEAGDSGGFVFRRVHELR